jgi:hypothetical protein
MGQKHHCPLYGAFLVKGVPQGSHPFSHPSVSLFDLAAVSSPRPTHRVAGARRSGQGWPCHWAATDRLGLDGSEHDGILVVVGMTTSEGELRVGAREIVPRPCMRRAKDPNHDAVIRIGSKLRGGGPILCAGIKAMGECGTPPPRTVIGEPVASV